MTIPTPPTVTIRETITSTLSASSSTTGQPLPTQGHPFPHAFPFAGQPPPIGYMPPIFPTGGSPPIVAGQPGTLVSPFAAVLCILTVAGCYWGFRYLPQMQQQAINPTSTSSADAKDSKEKDKDKTTEETASGATIPAITPAAFISLFCFALLAAVIIQGPLGLSAAFEGTEASTRTTIKAVDTGSNLLSTFKLIEVLGLGGSRREGQTQREDGSKLGGQYNVVGPGGASSSNWYISPGSGGDTSKQTVQGEQLSVTDALALASLPPALQELGLCRREPQTCLAIMGASDSKAFGGGLNDPSSPNAGNGMTAQPKPVPLIPQQGFLGSYQGLKSLENAFYPMLIGALGLIVLFDYGT